MTPLLAVPSVLAELAAVPGLLEQADIDRARAEWEVLGPLPTSRAEFERVFPSATIQTIHGDAPAYNVIRTAEGVLWSDFEDTTLGPIEWDMAGFGPDLGKVYNEAAVALGRPVLGDGIRMFVGQWRDTPFAGGLG